MINVLPFGRRCAALFVATVEPAHVFALARIALRQSREFPNQLERYRIDFQDPRAIAERVPRAVRRPGIRIAESPGAAIVKDQDIARPRQPFGMIWA